MKKIAKKVNKVVLILILFMISFGIFLNQSNAVIHYSDIANTTKNITNEAQNTLNEVEDENVDNISNLSFDTIQNEVTTENAYDYSNRSETVANIIGALMTIAQVLLVFIAILIFIISIIKYIFGAKENRPKLKKRIGICLVIVFIMYGISFVLGVTRDFKPIIYLYPEEDTELNVSFEYPENLEVTYPKYENGWNVLAKTDGTLIDLNTGRSLYSLYYENKNSVNFKVEKDGFIVEGEDVSSFLEEKLALLGLNERESEEFIVYWLPILEKNKYNYIRFATKEEIDENMPIDFSTEPDTFIRVLMTYKKVLIPFDVEPQKIETPERTGFVVVEWGGTEIK